jgi:N-acyl-L-homoserine lactone synthetase
MFMVLASQEATMVTVVTQNNRKRHANLVDGMFRDRRAVFVDALSWPLSVTADGLEIDQFDGDDAVYLIDASGAGAHLASLRLLPTTGPHLMQHAFEDLCEGGVPIGDDIWEMTRLCSSPGLPAAEATAARQRVARAMVEFGLLFGINTFVGTTHIQYLSRLLAFGWACEPLGQPRIIEGVLTGAIAIRTSPESLAVFRKRTGSRFPALELERGLAA